VPAGPVKAARAGSVRDRWNRRQPQGGGARSLPHRPLSSLSRASPPCQAEGAGSSPLSSIRCKKHNDAPAKERPFRSDRSVRKCVSYEPFVLDVGVAVRPRPSVDYLLPSCGSLENLNDRIWCGSSLCSRRIRCTVVGEMPDAAAIGACSSALSRPGDGSGIVASTGWSPGEA